MNNAVIGTYYYDGDGKRVKKAATTENIVFVYDAAGKLIEEYSGSTLQTAYVYAGSRLLTTETATGTNYLTSDHLGTPRINTDATGNVTARHDYMPFGEEIFTVGGRTTGLGYNVDNVRKKFSGYERDSESSLDFAQARFFSNQTGRFYSADPENAAAQDIEPQSWNAYLYAGNNPLLYSDPDGEDYVLCDNTGKCFGRNTDKQFEEARKAGGFKFKDGIIYDLDGTKRGTYTYVSGDEPIGKGPGFLEKGIGGLGLGAIVGGTIGGGSIGGSIAGVGGTIIGGPSGSGRVDVQENRARGTQFENDVLSALGLPKNTSSVTVNGVTTIPDGMNSKAIVEIKNARRISLTRQIRTQIAVARQTGKTYYLIISPNTQRLSQNLINAVRASGGQVLVFAGRGTNTGKPHFISPEMLFAK